MSENELRMTLVRTIDNLAKHLSVTTDRVALLETEVEELRKRSDFLACLEQAGVDNWEGYSHACRLRDEEEEEDEE